MVSAARSFIETNTHRNITMKREFVYLEDVKTAININTLEERIILKRWLLSVLQKRTTKDDLMNLLENLAEKDRHRLQKDFKITL